MKYIPLCLASCSTWCFLDLFLLMHIVLICSRLFLSSISLSECAMIYLSIILEMDIWVILSLSISSYFKAKSFPLSFDYSDCIKFSLVQNNREWDSEKRTFQIKQTYLFVYYLFWRANSDYRQMKWMLDKFKV